MENQGFSIQWVPVDNSLNVTNEEVITMEARTDNDNVHNYIEILPSNLDQIAAENLIYMANDGHIDGLCDDLIEEDPEGVTEPQTKNQIIQVYEHNCRNQIKNETDHNTSCDIIEVENPEEEIIDDQSQYYECQVTTEEIITDDWVQQLGEERVEVSVDQITAGDALVAEEIDVPLPTDQDEYTALRPYPCDFCSKRFKKKLSLMNHMVAHKNDRPHICNFCGCRYMRRTDLMNHLKIHASMGDHHIDEYEENFMHPNELHQTQASNRRTGGDHYYDQVWDEVEAMTENYDRRKNNKKQNSSMTKYKIGGRYKKDIEIKTEIETENSYSEEVNHYPILDDRKPFVCQSCGIAFAREKALLSHQRVHVNNSPTFECNNCNEVFYDNESLNDHQKVHRFEESHSEYEPEKGDESDSNESSKYGEFYCNVCGMSFHRHDLLRRHSKLHVKRETFDNNYFDEDLRHCCNVCGENFSEALDLLAHAEVHARSQPFKCVLCGETFLEEATIKKHVSNVHSKELTPHSCVLCGKPCRDRKSLIKHAWEHSKEKNHPCSKCGKTFHNKARLNRHMVSHRNKTVICEICREEFPDGRSLMNHRHSHSNTSGKLFPCNECGKTFGSRSSQQIHIRIHTGERPYGCRYCWKAFADGGTLRKHERIHTGEKPYVCSVCPRAFNQRVVLREHIRSHHSSLDIKTGTYYCVVCHNELPSSLDLIQHLIQHSDMHTAMKRQPITGPRKYKRRRKLKPHELERLRKISDHKEGISDIEYSDLDMGDVDDLLGITSKAKKSNRSSTYMKNQRERDRTSSTSSTNRMRKYSTNSEKMNSSNWQTKLMNATANEDFNSVISNLENTLQNIDTLVVSNTPTNSDNQNDSSIRLLYENSELNPPIECSKTTPITSFTSNKTTKGFIKNKKSHFAEHNTRRPKMIHTQKTRVSVEDGKRKTRTLITTEPVENYFTSNRQNSQIRHIEDLIIPDEINNASRATVQIKQESFEDQNQNLASHSDFYNAQLLLEAASARNELEKYNPNVVNDLDEILRSPEKNKSPKTHSEEIESDKKCDLKLFQMKDKNSTRSEGMFFEERLSSRSRRIVPNRKYLEYETTPPRITASKSYGRQSTKQKYNKTGKQLLKNKTDIKIKDELIYNDNDESYNDESFDTENITIKCEVVDSASPVTPETEKATEINIKRYCNPDNSPENNASSSPVHSDEHQNTTSIDSELVNLDKYKCEMCSASFPDRAQLLVHVPIHI